MVENQSFFARSDGRLTVVGGVEGVAMSPSRQAAVVNDSDGHAALVDLDILDMVPINSRSATEAWFSPSGNWIYY